MGKIKDVLSKIAGWFQPAYNDISKWDLPPDLKAQVNAVWVNLPISVQSAIWKLIKDIADKYGDDLAQVILQKVIDALSRVK
jgi:hypothetical protein